MQESALPVLRLLLGYRCTLMGEHLRGKAAKTDALGKESEKFLQNGRLVDIDCMT